MCEWLSWANETLPRQFGKVRTAARVVRRKGSSHILKALGLTVAISFGSASLFYAKRAADDARCQLRLAQLQYCETQNKTECQDFLNRSDVPRYLTLCGWSKSGGKMDFSEWIFSLAGPYRLSYTCDGLLNAWWTRWGFPYSARTGRNFRPLFWRFPDLYMVAEYLTSYHGNLVLGGCVVYATYLCYQSRCQRKDLFRVLLVMTIPLLIIILAWWISKAEMRHQRDHFLDLVLRRPRTRMMEEDQLSRFQWPNYYFNSTFEHDALRKGSWSLMGRKLIADGSEAGWYTPTA